MKTFHKQAAQGDILITRVAKISSNVAEQQPTRGMFVLSHDAGHPHVVGADGARCLLSTDNPLVLFLDIAEETRIKHQRPFDTHEDIQLLPGTYEVRRQREWTPEGFRAVVD